MTSMNKSGEEMLIVLLALLLKQVGGSISISPEELHILKTPPDPVIETFHTETGAFVIRVKE